MLDRGRWVEDELSGEGLAIIMTSKTVLKKYLSEHVFRLRSMASASRPSRASVEVQKEVVHSTTLLVKVS